MITGLFGIFSIYYVHYVFFLHKYNFNNHIFFIISSLALLFQRHELENGNNEIKLIKGTDRNSFGFILYFSFIRKVSSNLSKFLFLFQICIPGRGILCLMITVITVWCNQIGTVRKRNFYKPITYESHVLTSSEQIISSAWHGRTIESFQN